MCRVEAEYPDPDYLCHLQLMRWITMNNSKQQEHNLLNTGEGRLIMQRGQQMFYDWIILLSSHSELEYEKHFPTEQSLWVSYLNSQAFRSLASSLFC